MTEPSPSELAVPELSLVVLVGATGSGKSTFARAHFRPTEVISSDFCRGLVADDENDQSATPAAFELLHYIAGKRRAAGPSPSSTRPTWPGCASAGLSHKRSLALREYTLGLEALDRVARGEPLWRVHECVFAVLALESGTRRPPALTGSGRVGTQHPDGGGAVRAAGPQPRLSRVEPLRGDPAKVDGLPVIVDPSSGGPNRQVSVSSGAGPSGAVSSHAPRPAARRPRSAHAATCGGRARRRAAAVRCRETRRRAAR